MRRASRATWTAWRRSMACSGCRRAVATSPRTDPLVARCLAGHQPLPQTADGGHDAGAPVAVDRIGGERHAGRGRRDHRWTITAMRPPTAGPYSATRAARALARQRRRPRRCRPRTRRAPTRTCRRTIARRRPRRCRSSEPRTARRRGPTLRLPTATRRSSAVMSARLGGHDHAVGHADARGHQLAEAGRLAADLGDIGHAHVAEPSDPCRRVIVQFLSIARPRRWRRARPSRCHPPPLRPTSPR